LSMEFFRLEDINLDGIPSALSSEDINVMIRPRSAELVEDIFLPDTTVTASAGAKLDRSTSPLSSEDINVTIRLHSAELIEELFLLDAAVTASTALIAEQPVATSNGQPPSQNQPENIFQLTSKMGRMSTGEEIVPLDEKMRITSEDWLQEFAAEPINLGAMKPSLFWDKNQYISSIGTVAVQRFKSPQPMPRPSGVCSQPPLNSTLVSPQCPPAKPSCKDSKLVNNDNLPVTTMTIDERTSTLPKKSSSASGYQQISTTPSRNSRSHELNILPAATNKEPQISIASSRGRSSPTPSMTSLCGLATTADKKGKKPCTKKTTKKRKPRLLDMTRAVEKTNDDILFGRGSGTNTHPGNEKFRNKALEFLPWYTQSSKEEKEEIANLLVESVKSEGCRFLEKKDGLWYEVIRGEHTKACATFRDLKDGKTKKKKSTPGP